MDAEEPADGQPAFDPGLLIDVASSYLFDAAPSLTQEQVAEAAGVELDEAVAMWRHLGFSEVGPGVVAFTPADVEAVAPLAAPRSAMRLAVASRWRRQM